MNDDKKIVHAAANMPEHAGTGCPVRSVAKSFAGYVKLDLRIPAALTINEIVDMVSMKADSEALFIMVAAIDEAVCDWNFTEKCFEHFKDLMEQKKIEDKEGETWPKSRSHTSLS